MGLYTTLSTPDVPAMVPNPRPLALLVDNSEEDALLLRLSMKNAAVDLDLLVLASGQALRDYILGENSHSKSLRLPSVIFLPGHVDHERSTVLQTWLLTQPQSQHIPIIVLTGGLDPKIFEEAKASGARECFEKPMTRENWETVRSLLSLQ